MPTDNIQTILNAEDLANELWADLPDFSMYQISNMGRLRNKKKPTKYLTFVKTKGYYKTNLYHEKNIDLPKQKATTVRIHRLVAETFIPNPENKPVVDHENRGTFDNRVCNLRWATLSENGANSKIWSNNKSGVKGVSLDKSRNKYITVIQFNKKKIHIGYYDTIEEATSRRRDKEIELFGEFRPA